MRDIARQEPRAIQLPAAPVEKIPHAVVSRRANRRDAHVEKKTKGSTLFVRFDLWFGLALFYQRQPRGCQEPEGEGNLDRDCN